MGTTVPIQNERVARELSPLKGDPETMNRVWGGVVEEYGESPAAKHVRNAVDQAKTAERIRAQLPPATRTVVEGIDPDDCNLPNEPKQLTHLLDASLKHGDEQTAQTAKRVANGEFKSTFDAYPEIKSEGETSDDEPPVGEYLQRAGVSMEDRPRRSEEEKAFHPVQIKAREIRQWDTREYARACPEIRYLDDAIENFEELEVWVSRAIKDLKEERHESTKLRAMNGGMR